MTHLGIPSCSSLARVCLFGLRWLSWRISDRKDEVQIGNHILRTVSGRSCSSHILQATCSWLSEIDIAVNYLRSDLLFNVGVTCNKAAYTPTLTSYLAGTRRHEHGMEKMIFSQKLGSIGVE